MLTLGHQKTDWISLGVVVFLAAVAIGVGVLEPSLLPWALGAMVLAAGMVFWAARWDITLCAWIWVLSYGLLDWPEWKIELIGFFNLTVPRIIFLGVVLTFALYFFFHRRRLHFDRALYWLMLALLCYVAFSATTTGWTARTKSLESAPYYRFLGSLLLPFVMFYLLCNSCSKEKQIRRALILVTIYGWYALYIGYLQYAAINGLEGARSFIWPSYINDPTFGIHFDRARGVFRGATPQAFLMVSLFYIDLYLIRKTRGAYRALLVVQAILVPPAVFFTLLRSAYLAFLICGFLWVFLTGQKRFRWLKTAGLFLLLVIFVYASWERLSSTDRAGGGVAQRSPIRSRIILIQQTWDIMSETPLLGVGFGHFVDKQQSMPRDPGGLSGEPTGVLVQHNLFLNMLAETGLVGFVLMLLVFIFLWKQSYQLYEKIPPDARGDVSRDFVVLFWIILANYLTDAMFRDPLWDVFTNALLWSLAGIVVCFNRLLEPQPLDLPIAAGGWEGT
ncbi:MAG: O-antigen ligase family protein [Phycisphaerae bacterium]|nr:O-antigen ligase family protein [Phycisphaerae bacterium]